jgi:hypothetical protein
MEKNRNGCHGIVTNAAILRRFAGNPNYIVVVCLFHERLTGEDKSPAFQKQSDFYALLD